MEKQNNKRGISNSEPIQLSLFGESNNEPIEIIESKSRDIQRKPDTISSQDVGDGLTDGKRLSGLLNELKANPSKFTQEEILKELAYIENTEVKLKLGIPSKEDLSSFLNYTTGGVRKEDRGVLDEYFTPPKIIDSIGTILSIIYNKEDKLHILEPSVGDGNFLALDKLFPNSKFIGFEINPLISKISKLKYPNASIYNRGFETNFIDEDGNKHSKSTYQNSYDLVIGNPPYGLHRGYYKGLGEESKIARYEDYFVKRSLDVLKESGTIAMVLPSGWLNRQRGVDGYELVDAYRLPNGVFDGTDVGTDIIIIKKNSANLNKAYNRYFELYPDKVLGEIHTRTNRFGREEEYVKGTLTDAIEKLNHQISLHKGQYVKYTLREITNLNILNTKEEKKHEAKPIKYQDYKLVTPDKINSNHIKYTFKKDDIVVPASHILENTFDDLELQALQNTFYDGSLESPEKHSEFANYYNGKYYHDFYYVEGNLYQKLQTLEVEKDQINEAQYLKQKSLLENHLPTPKTLDEIFISPNHEFVSKFIVGSREVDYYDYNSRSSKSEIRALSLADEFKYFIDTLDNQVFQGSSSWEVKAFVDNEAVRGSDKERNALIRERRKEVANDLFNKYLRDELSPDIQQRFVKDFNTFYNSVYIPDYSKFPLFSQIHQNFNGSPLMFSEVQQSGVGQLTTKGVGILAHEVGFGKTLSGIMAMHEAMYRGYSQRPLIVVPNENILKQWVDTIYQVIPSAKVNVLGNLGVNYDLSNFKVEDGEISIVTYSGFNNIGFGEDVIQSLADKFTYISEQETRNVKLTTREEELEISKLEELEGTMKKGKVYSWEDFGFDHMTFDEVHNANHIISKVRLEDRNHASDFRSQQQATSLLGINTWVACQYLQEEYDGRNVTLLSATPFTNKPLEYYSVLSLVANDRLKELGFFNVNTFFETFMDADQEMEINALGEVTYRTNVNRFKNNNIFQSLLREYIDIKGTEDNPNLKRPERINKEYRIPQNTLTELAYNSLLSSYDSTADGAILTHITDSRKIAISPYLISGIEDIPAKVFIENSPKIATTLELIKQNLKDIPDAGQIIYTEIGIEVFPKIQQYLVEEGVLEKDEIRIITGKTTKAQRIRYQEEFNSGKAKLILGSSAIQEGMNLQSNTTDMYLLSLPYNFTQLRQIEGRAWRQGNKHDHIRINYILTNDSIDVFMLQKLQSKQNRYEEAMLNKEEILDISDISTSELKTALITDPEVRANIEVQVIEQRLIKEKDRHIADQAFVLRKYEGYTKLLSQVRKEEDSLVYAQQQAEKGDRWYQHRVPIIEGSLKAIHEKFDDEVENLKRQGVNVDKISEQREYTNLQIESLNNQIKDLEEVKKELIEKYKIEQREQILEFSLEDILKDRQGENKNLLNAYTMEDNIRNIAKEEEMAYNTSISNKLNNNDMEILEIHRYTNKDVELIDSMVKSENPIDVLLDTIDKGNNLDSFIEKLDITSELSTYIDLREIDLKFEKHYNNSKSISEFKETKIGVEDETKISWEQNNKDLQNSKEIILEKLSENPIYKKALDKFESSSVTINNSNINNILETSNIPNSHVLFHKLCVEIDSKQTGKLLEIGTKVEIRGEEHILSNIRYDGEKGENSKYYFENKLGNDYTIRKPDFDKMINDKSIMIYNKPIEELNPSKLILTKEVLEDLGEHRKAFVVHSTENYINFYVEASKEFPKAEQLEYLNTKGIEVLEDDKGSQKAVFIAYDDIEVNLDTKVDITHDQREAFELQNYLNPDYFWLSMNIQNDLLLENYAYAEYQIENYEVDPWINTSEKSNLLEKIGFKENESYDKLLSNLGKLLSESPDLQEAQNLNKKGNKNKNRKNRNKAKSY